MSKHIGEAIREIRIESNMRQGVLAEKIGVSKNSINQIEKGNAVPHNRNLIKISEALKVPIGLIYLRTLDENDVPEHKKPIFNSLFPNVIQIMDTIFKE